MSFSKLEIHGMFQIRNYLKLSKLQIFGIFQIGNFRNFELEIFRIFQFSKLTIFF